MRERRRHAAMAIVTALVLAACGGGDDEAEGGREPEPEQTGALAADIVITGTDALEFEPSEVEARAGTISVSLTAEGAPHTFTVELEGGDQTVVQAFTPGEPAMGGIELEAGRYTFYCAIGGHRESGMEGTLTVS